MKKFNFKKVIPYVVAIVVFIAISLIYFSPLLEGKRLNQSDVMQYKGSSKEILDYRTTTGEEVLWTNSMFGGMPAYQISVLYKTSIVPYFSKIMMAGLPFPANILFVLFLGFFILLVVLKVDPWLSIVGSIAFAFSSYFLLYISVGHNAQALAVAYIPTVVAGIILTFRGKYLLGGAVTALFMAIEISVNHVQMTYYMLIIIGFIVLFEFIYAIIQQNIKAFFTAIGVLVVAGFIAIGPNVTNLWTSSEYVKETIRGKSELTLDKKIQSSGLDKDYITQWSYGIGETFTLMIPDAKGGESEAIGSTKSALDGVDKQYKEGVAQQSRYWGNLPFTAGPVYVGAFILFLFVLGLFIVKGKLKWALLGATILAILLSWGHNFMFLTNFFIDYVPFYNKFRAVSSVLIVVEFAMPVLAILALKEIAEKPKLIKEKKGFFFIALGMTAGLTLLFLLMPSVFFNFTTPVELSQFNQYLKQGADKAQIDGFISNLETARISIFTMSCVRTLAFILIGAGLLWIYASAKKMSKYVLYGAVALLLLIDLVPIDRRYLNDKNFVAKSKIDTPFEMTTADNAILQDTTKDYRVLNLASGDFSRDASASFYHKSIGGYHAAKLRRFQDLIDNRLVKEHDRLIKTLQSNVPDSVLISTLYGLTTLNMLNTKYYIYNPEARPLRNPAAMGNAWFVKEVKMVDNADEEIKALDNFYPANTAIVDKRFATEVQAFKGDKNPQATIKLVNYKPNYLTYEAKNLKAEQLAVFSEIYYSKGWNAYIDGNKVPYLRANYILRALVVPAGDHKIEFKFEPKSYYTGEKISLVGSILLILFIGIALFFEFRKKRDKTPSILPDKK
ncbi:MAG: YfhO family protein [Bacteroidota bacterium]